MVLIYRSIWLTIVLPEGYMNIFDYRDSIPTSRIPCWSDWRICVPVERKRGLRRVPSRNGISPSARGNSWVPPRSVPPLRSRLTRADIETGKRRFHDKEMGVRRVACRDYCRFVYSHTRYECTYSQNVRAKRAEKDGVEGNWGRDRDGEQKE